MAPSTSSSPLLSTRDCASRHLRAPLCLSATHRASLPATTRHRSPVLLRAVSSPFVCVPWLALLALVVALAFVLASLRLPALDRCFACVSLVRNVSCSDALNPSINLTATPFVLACGLNRTLASQCDASSSALLLNASGATEIELYNACAQSSAVQYCAEAACRKGFGDSASDSADIRSNVAPCTAPLRSSVVWVLAFVFGAFGAIIVALVSATVFSEMRIARERARLVEEFGVEGVNDSGSPQRRRVSTNDDGDDDGGSVFVRSEKRSLFAG
jgi:hypothetical protein